MNLPFPDFNIIRLDRPDRHGGVLLGIKKHASFYRVDLRPMSGIEVVACQVTIRGKSLSIASIYLPPKTAVSPRDLSHICSVMPEPRLLLGDFNSHGTGWGALYDDNRANLIYDLCDDFNMTILNTGEVTRVAPSANFSTLDLSICSSSLSLDCSWRVVQDPHGSDHMPIEVSISNGPYQHPAIDIAYDLTKHIDWEKYANAISDGEQSVDVLPPREEYHFLSELVLNSALQAQRRPVPKAAFRRKPPAPWWDSECTDLYREKSVAFKDFRKHGSVDRYERYSVLERKFKNIIKAKKTGYWRHFVDGLSRETSMRTLWTVGRRMRNASSVNEDRESSARWIFDFAKKVCPDSVPVEQVQRAPVPERDGTDRPFSMVEFSLALLSCNNSAPGIDRIKFNLLKNLPDVAKRRLLNLFNQFLEGNIVPDEWRQVRVIAIQKPGKPASNCNSYRPIAMLSCIRKLLEKMILHRLENWAESNSLLSDTQFGFRRGKGTNDCLSLLSSEIQLAFANKEQMGSVFLDIKGAFDSVCVDILSDKLHACGLSPILNNYLNNLLAEKQMNFSHGDSTTSRISYMGLPQGSCLSPLLYNFYVRDIDGCLVENCTIRQLADDCVVSFTGPTAVDLQGPLQDTLDNLSTWALQLGIEFSTEKTEMVVFSKKHKPAKFTLRLKGEPITHSLSYKYLGVWFDSKCTWGKHIVYLTKKCQQRINFMRTITGTWWGAHPEDLIMLFRTTILSIIEYGSFCFQSAAKTHLLKLQRIQYRCLRIALGSMNSTHTMSLEVLAGVQPVTDRFAELSLRFLIRCEVMNPLVIVNFEKLLEQNFQNRFMLIYYWYMTLEVGPSSVETNRDNFSDFFGSSVVFDLSMRQETHGIPEFHRAKLIPPIFASKYGHASDDRRFFTDGSKIGDSSGFGVFNAFHSASFSLQKPCSVYVAELAAIHYALEHIASLPSEHYFIFTDSLSSLEAIRSMKPVKHSAYFLKGIRNTLSALSKRSYTITMAWIPSHCSIPGNEKADSLARVGAMEGDTFERQIAFDEFFAIVRQETLNSWQRKWTDGDMGRWLHSIVPQVSTKPWFKGLGMSRDFIRVMCRLMSNHYALNAHTYRIGLSESNLCVCGEDYQDIDHVVWGCGEYCAERSELTESLRVRGKQQISIREVLATLDYDYMFSIYSFLKRISVKV